MEAGDPGQQAVSSVSQFEGLEGHVPASMIFVQTTQQQVHQAMNPLEGMIRG
jgi:uncharacterized membrane protein affecting hemolysin expression